MLISVFTPTNNTTWLREAWDSLRDAVVDFEWVVGLNGNPDISNIPDDPRVVRIDLGEWKGVGAAKRALCEAARGEVLVELDHDDVLACGALEDVRNVFQEHPEVGFAYSDCASWLDSTGKPHVYSSAYGWTSYPCEIRGRNLIAMRAFPPSVERLSTILYAPNHVRAWRKSAYEAAGGHDPTLDVGDDYDLVLRTFLVTKFCHIQKPLYGYRHRADGANTWLKNMDKIQELCGVGKDRSKPTAGQPLPLRDKYFHRLVERDCDLRNLPKVDLGGGISPAPGWTSLDISGNPNIKWDVFGSKRLPFADASIGAFRAFDFLEHGEDADAFWLMDEIHRCLVSGGHFVSCTPHALGIGSSCDPSHRSRWDERRFLYWCSDELRPFLQSAYPPARAKFKPLRLFTEMRSMGPTPWKFEIPYVVADLVKVDT